MTNKQIRPPSLPPSFLIDLFLYTFLTKEKYTTSLYQKVKGKA